MLWATQCKSGRWEAGFAALKDCATEGATTCEMTECGTAAIFAVSPTCQACIIGTAAAQAERAGAGRRLQAGLPDGFDITPELIQVIEGTCAPLPQQLPREAAPSGSGDAGGSGVGIIAVDVAVSWSFSPSVTGGTRRFACIS